MVDPFGTSLRIPYSLGDKPPFERMMDPPRLSASGSKRYFCSLKRKHDTVPCEIYTADEEEIPTLELQNLRNCNRLVEVGSDELITILPYDRSRMELVPTKDGIIPKGRRPVLGGCGNDGVNEYYAVNKLYGIVSIRHNTVCPVCLFTFLPLASIYLFIAIAISIHQPRLCSSVSTVYPSTNTQ